MKKTILILVSTVILAGCYGKDYLMDYDYNAVYVAYQYDLRTFIPDEQVAVGFTVGLAGALQNTRDRKIDVEIDNTLLSRDLSKFDPSGQCASFTAIDGLLGNGGLGTVSQKYVTNEVKAAGITSLAALPESYYTTSQVSGLCIKQGRHTAEIRLTPTEEMFKDSKILNPYYAIGFQVINADADSLLPDKSFQIMAIKVENRFYGNWYHGGRTRVINNKTGETVSSEYYDREIPQDEQKLYVLTTDGFNSVLTDKIGKESGCLRLTFNKDEGNTINVQDPTEAKDIAPIAGQPSFHNGAKLIQNREIYLNYKYSNGDGTTTYVTDTLGFRNRIRDGINEWQDENTENY